MGDDEARRAVGRVFARRERHRRRPLPVRWAIAGLGLALGVLGAILALPLPEAGLPLLVVALGLLALEFDGAARLLAVAVLATGRLRRGFRALPRPTRLAAVVIPVALVVVAVLIVRAAVFHS